MNDVNESLYKYEGRIKKVNPSNGWFWINEGVRYFVQEKRVWMNFMFSIVFVSLLLQTFFPLAPLFFMVIFPFITGGLSIVCVEMEKGNRIPFNSLFQGFTSENKINIFRYGLLLIILMIVAILVSSILLGLLGVSQEELENALVEFKKSPKGGLFTFIQSPVLFKYLVTVIISMIPIVIINFLAPILLVFSKLTAFEAIRISLIAGLKNFLTLFIYGFIYISISLILLLGVYFVGNVLFSILGDSSIVATVINFVLVFLVIMMIASISYSSAFVAYKDIFIGDEN